MRLAAIADDQDEEEAGGLEQARHPAQEVVTAAPIGLAPTDPLGLGEDDGDPAADKRAMDQAATGTAPRAYALDMADRRPGNLELDF